MGSVYFQWLWCCWSVRWDCDKKAGIFRRCCRAVGDQFYENKHIWKSTTFWLKSLCNSKCIQWNSQIYNISNSCIQGFWCEIVWSRRQRILPSHIPGDIFGILREMVANGSWRMYLKYVDLYWKFISNYCYCELVRKRERMRGKERIRESVAVSHWCWGIWGIKCFVDHIELLGSSALG